MTGVIPWTSDIESDCSTNWATITSQKLATLVGTFKSQFENKIYYINSIQFNTRLYLESDCTDHIMIKISFRINKLNPQAPEYSMVNSCRHLNVTGSGCVPGLLIAGAKDSVDDELEEQNATRDIENCVPGFKSRLWNAKNIQSFVQVEGQKGTTKYFDWLSSILEYIDNIFIFEILAISFDF